MCVDVYILGQRKQIRFSEVDMEQNNQEILIERNSIPDCFKPTLISDNYGHCTYLFIHLNIPHALTAAKVYCNEMAKINSGWLAAWPIYLCHLKYMNIFTQSIVFAPLASSYLNWTWKKKQYPLPLATVACLAADAAALEWDPFQMQWKVLHKVLASADSSWLYVCGFKGKACSDTTAATCGRMPLPLPAAAGGVGCGSIKWHESPRRGKMVHDVDMLKTLRSMATSVSWPQNISSLVS